MREYRPGLSKIVRHSFLLYRDIPDFDGELYKVALAVNLECRHKIKVLN